MQGCNCRSPCQLTGLAISINKNKEIGIFYHVYYLKNNEEAVKLIKQTMKKGDIVLVKASNGMHFDEIVEKIK